jgi:addiction module HigA family antidote
MILTRRKPVTVGEMLSSEFMEPLNITQTELAVQSGLPRKHVNELCGNRRAVTADTALILARVFRNSADFWLNTQRRTDLWEAMNTPKRRTRIQRAKPIASRRLAVA